MKKSSIVWLIVVIVVVVVAAYAWWALTPSSPSPAGTPQAAASTTSATGGTSSSGSGSNSGTGAAGSAGSQSGTFHTITLNNSGGGQFGEFLTAANGMTLYQYTKDNTNVSNCTGTCATTWPPYIVTAAEATTLTADPGITGKIGTIKRADGSLQVTYRGLPLYFYAGDAQPGDTNGEAVNGFTEVAP